MSIDPVAAMELEEKRRLVEADERLAEAKKALADRLRAGIPEAARNGRILPLVLYPNDVLAVACRAHESFDRDLELLTRNMLFTMYACGGVGLAAPQVGFDMRIFVCDWSEKRCQPQVMVNPSVTPAHDTGAWLEQEACLSLPGVRVPVARSERVLLRYQDERGKAHEVELDRWPARIVQHEMDHLEGATMLDRVGRLQRRMALKSYEKNRRRLER